MEEERAKERISLRHSRVRDRNLANYIKQKNKTKNQNLMVNERMESMKQIKDKLKETNISNNDNNLITWKELETNNENNVE